MEKARSQSRALLALAILLAFCSCAFALDPSLDINQYAHTAWKIREGFSKGRIYLIAQTPDGYLWLGTEFGLFRFDGVRQRPMGAAWRASIFPAATFEACSPHAMGHSGLAPIKDWQAGRTAS